MPQREEKIQVHGRTTDFVGPSLFSRQGKIQATSWKSVIRKGSTSILL